MRKVSQVVIAAGGRGTRISSSLNPKGCKSFIEHNGKPLLEILVDALAEAGIERFIISTQGHTDAPVRQLMRSKPLDSIVVPVSEMGKFRWIPYYVQDLLDERFLFVCGHHPLSMSLVMRMLKTSESHKFVAAAYQPKLFTADRAAGLEISYNPKTRILCGKKTALTESAGLLIDSPYILSKDILPELERNPGQEYSRYILDRQRKGEAVGVVESSMPPEFDYDDELRLTMEALASTLVP